VCDGCSGPVRCDTHLPGCAAGDWKNGRGGGGGRADRVTGVQANVVVVVLTGCD
jgi:hypothetical protein